MIKEEAKQKEWAADKAIMEEYAAQLDKQEAARKAQASEEASSLVKKLAACNCVVVPAGVGQTLWWSAAENFKADSWYSQHENHQARIYAI